MTNDRQVYVHFTISQLQCIMAYHLSFVLHDVILLVTISCSLGKMYFSAERQNNFKRHELITKISKKIRFIYLKREENSFPLLNFNVV